MKKILFALGFAGTVAVAFSGCYNDNAEELYPPPPASNCDTTNVTYDATIRNIMSQNCALSGCHATGSNLGGYILDAYAGTVAAVNSGRFLGSINHTAGFSPMPKNMSKLNACDIARIQAWVNKGMPQ